MKGEDIRRAAEFLGMEEQAFRTEYCLQDGDEMVLKDQEDDLQSCIFLFEDEQGLAGCRIHGAKPEQCAGFPFEWRPRNVLKFCDGMRALEGLAPTRGEGRRRMDGKGGPL